MRVKRSDRAKARLEMIPLIDVTFILVSFFIYLSLFMVFQRGIPVALPEAETTEAVPMKVLTVTLNAQGLLEIDGLSATWDTLGDVLRKNVGIKNIGMVLLRAEAQTPCGLMVQVLDAMRAVGVTRVSLEAQPKGVE